MLEDWETLERRFHFALRKLSPSIIFVSETKLTSSRISTLRQQLNFSYGVGVDCVGRKGGYAIFWKDDRQVVLKSYSPGHVDTFVTDPNDNTWRFTGFYGNPVRNQRHLSWDLIRRLHSIYSLPWVIGGDFNTITHLSEKYGGSNVCSASMAHFCDTINQCGLVDLGYDGPHLLGLTTKFFQQRFKKA